jgi:1-aminocyclopropane-1-carboxylate deaminase
MKDAKNRPSHVQGIIRPLPNNWGCDLSLLQSPVKLPHLGGNKFFKLKGYVDRARELNLTHLITMAGAHSNHLRAFAALAKAEGFQATALVRGDELVDPARQSDIIRFAQAQGVRCFFIARSAYRALREAEPGQRPSLVPNADFAGAVFIPEGGLGAEGVSGIKPWAASLERFETIYLPCATGTTAAGFLAATKSPTRVVAAAVLRNETQVHETMRLLAQNAVDRFELVTQFADTFGKTNGDLTRIAEEYSAAWGIRIDDVYMVRTVLALKGDIEAGRERGKTLLVYTYNE